MENKTIITAKEVAEYLGIGLTTTYKMLKTNEIPNTRFGKKYLIKVDCLNAMFEN